MTPFNIAQRNEWDAQVAVAEAKQLPERTPEERDRKLEAVRLATELRLVRLAQLRVAELEHWRAQRQTA